MSFMITVAVLVIGLLHFVKKVVFPPWNFPRNIPTIPFYATLLTTLFDMDQKEFYDHYIREQMEKHGAVKIYFGSRWNILISKPELLSQIFRDEDTFAKSGNQKKIPYSILAQYTGENVISAHGATWRTFRNIMNKGLQTFNTQPMSENADKFISILKEEMSDQGPDILMPNILQRLVLANIAEVTLGFDIGTLKIGEQSELQAQLKEVKKHIFAPFYLNFPFLDSLPIPSRRRARKLVAEFRDNVLAEVRKNMVENYNYEQTSYAASHLIKAHELGEITEKQLKDNIMILLIAGHENPQLLITSCLYLLAKYPEWQNQLRERALELTDEQLHDCAEFNQFLFETVRIMPPLSQIVNRLTSKKCVLGTDIVLPKNVYVGYQVYGTGTSEKVWGADAAEFKPERWGKTNEQIHEAWRRAKNSSAMGAFHGGRRACLGERLGLVEMRITMAHMLRELEWKLSPSWRDKVTPAGPLCPFSLRLVFNEYKQAS
ncbi:HFL168Wp [Eremothecium sinecaudum]|uniref:HFL168Wp n=1 Tax=Eremothecium sinecaudum TaxID=45286 RepID=A0A109UZL0_9SACH|nr:HFL168Wp [Eremothecium sinecaudum]AMD21688.1 HFL168Wp [Eremothecium sinecaudum]